MSRELTTLRRRVVHDALSARLAEARRRLSGDPEAVGFDTSAAPDPEQTLRVVMVHHLPRVRAGRATPSERDEYLTLLLSLAEASRDPDLRFFDAWNNAYETLAEHDFESALPSQFLRVYVDLLQSQLATLGSPDV